MNEEKLVESIIWARKCLRSHGYELIDDVEVIRERPWSTIILIKTAQASNIYLKITPPSYSYEAKLLQFIYTNISQNVTEIIALNSELHCFVAKDAGTCLANMSDKELHHKVLLKSAEIYANIQISSINYIDQLLAIGVTDWRIENLPLLYREFIAQEKFLLDSGLTLHELKILQELAGTMELICEKLSHFSIPDTLEHCDFDDDNILLNNKDDVAIINDWGDSVITHPFISHYNLLRCAKIYYNIEANHSKYISIEESYMSQWSDYGSKIELQQILDLSKTIAPFVFALNRSKIQTCAIIADSKYFEIVTKHMIEFLRDYIQNVKSFGI